MLEFWRTLWSPTENFVGAAVTVVVLHLWSRFRTRLTHLRWNADIQHFALSGTAPGLGNIEVLRNGEPVDNLFVATVRVTNDSMRDLSDLEIVAGLDDGCLFLQHSAQLAGSIKTLVYSEDYAKLLETARTTPEEQLDQHTIDTVTTRCAFAVPAFNRGKSVDLWFLIHTPSTVKPELRLSTDHVGVELRQRPPWQETLAVRNEYAGILGGGVGLITILVLGIIGVIPLWPSLGAYLLGSMATLVGILLIQAWRLLVRLLS